MELHEGDNGQVGHGLHFEVAETGVRKSLSKLRLAVAAPAAEEDGVSIAYLADWLSANDADQGGHPVIHLSPAVALPQSLL